MLQNSEEEKNKNWVEVVCKGWDSVANYCTNQLQNLFLLLELINKKRDTISFPTYAKFQVVEAFSYIAKANKVLKELNDKIDKETTKQASQKLKEVLEVIKKC